MKRSVDGRKLSTKLRTYYQTSWAVRVTVDLEQSGHDKVFLGAGVLNHCLVQAREEPGSGRPRIPASSTIILQRWCTE